MDSLAIDHMCIPLPWISMDFVSIDHTWIPLAWVSMDFISIDHIWISYPLSQYVSLRYSIVVLSIFFTEFRVAYKFDGALYGQQKISERMPPKRAIKTERSS